MDSGGRTLPSAPPTHANHTRHSSSRCRRSWADASAAALVAAAISSCAEALGGDGKPWGGGSQSVVYFSMSSLFYLCETSLIMHNLSACRTVSKETEQNCLLQGFSNESSQAGLQNRHRRGWRWVPLPPPFPNIFTAPFHHHYHQRINLSGKFVCFFFISGNQM